MIGLRGCRTLVTLAGPPRPRIGPELDEVAAIVDGALLFDEFGVIREVGDRAHLESIAPIGTSWHDAGDRMVAPGFVDAHTHLVFAGNRVNEFEMRCRGATYAEIASSGGGIRSTMRAVRAASEDALVEAGKRHAEWMLQSGTTTAEAKSGYGLSVEDELKLLRAIRRVGQETPLDVVPTFLGAHAVPPEYEGRAEAYVDLVIGEMMPRVEGLAEYADAFLEPKYFDATAARRIMEAAKRHGLGVRLHVDQLTRSGGAEIAAELGAKTADHLEQTDAGGIAALASAGVQPVLLPGSVYALGLSKFPDARGMIEAGLAVVLATDFNPGSSPTPSLPMTMSIACTQMRMTPNEALVAATVNAAYSLDRGGTIGSLEVGKRADFVLLDLEDIREVAYWFGHQPVSSVWRAGSEVVPRPS